MPIVPLRKPSRPPREPSWSRKAQEIMAKIAMLLAALHVVLVEVRTLASTLGLV